MKSLLLLFSSALVACAPHLDITLLSLADVENPNVTIKLTITAGEQVASATTDDVPLPVLAPFTIPDGFELLPLLVEVRAFVGEREVARGAADVAPGQTKVTIRFAVCSNGALEVSEACDDGNLTDGEGCDSTCKPTGCNSDVFTPGEVCLSTQNPVVANAAPSDILVEDTDGDQFLDLIASYPNQGKVRVFFGNDNNQFGDFFEVNVNTDANLVSVADLNQDGFFDFVVTTKTTFTVFTGRGDGTFVSGQTFFVGTDLRDLALADLDGDHLPEQITLDFEQNRVRTLPGLGDGTFDLNAPANTAVDIQPIAFSIADIDQDGDNDIITANASGSVSVVINDAGDLIANVPFSTNGTPASLTTADFNGDGLLDIAVTKQAGNNFVSIFTQRPNIQPINFQAGGNFAAPNNAEGLIAADVDLDRDFDIAVTSESDSNVTIFVNNGEGQFAPAEATIATTTGPKAITAGDINRDGLIDFITAGQDLGLIFSTP